MKPFFFLFFRAKSCDFIPNTSTHTDAAEVTSKVSERVNSLQYEEEKPNLIQQPLRHWACVYWPHQLKSTSSLSGSFSLAQQQLTV